MRFVAGILLAVATAAAARLPALTVDDVSNAADHSTGRVSPGEIVVIAVPGVGPEILVGQLLDAQNRVATELAGMRVLFDGVPAPVSYVVRGQVSVVVPYEVAGHASTAVVVEYQGERTEPVTIPVVAAAPALFTLDGSGRGQAGMLNQSGCCNSAANPAARGTLASLYATGEGQTRPRGQTGRVSAYDSVSKYPRPAGPVQVFVGGVAARIEYAGEAPHAVAGLLQVNFRVPATAPVGDAVPVVLMIGGIRSSEQATMAVRPAQQQVLLVEPDAAIRRRLERALKQAGFNVLGEDAANQPVDLVVAAMPSAADMVTSLRQLRPKLKVIATARALDAEVLRTADLAGAQAVVSGALSSAELVRKTRELLRSHVLPYELPRLPRVTAP